jgi:hypothetical protein
MTVTGGSADRSVCASALNGDTNMAADASTVLRTTPTGDARRNMNDPDASSLAGFAQLHELARPRGRTNLDGE